MKRFTLFLLIVATFTFAVACSSSKPAAVTVPENAKEFTMEELAKNDGTNGNPAYVAVDGVVYDVSNSKAWSNGNHQGKYQAGKDYTDVITQSPHGKKVLEKLPIVGKLKQ